MIAQLAHLFAPWQALYSQSRIIPIATEGAHLLAMLFGGGFAIAADRATLRVARKRIERRSAQLTDLHEVHRPVLIALAAALITGLALAAADVEVFAASRAFWVKLGLVALLLVNGLFFMRTEARVRAAHLHHDPPTPQSERLWGRMRLCSFGSILLWSATLVAGVVLMNAA